MNQSGTPPNKAINLTKHMQACRAPRVRFIESCLAGFRAKDEIGCTLRVLLRLWDTINVVDCTHQGTATSIEFPRMRSAAPYGYCSGFGIPLM